MSVGEGLGKTLGIGVLIAGAIGALWLFKDQIAGWFTSAVTAPITGAVQGAGEALSEAAGGVLDVVEGTGVTVGTWSMSAADVIRTLTPGAGLFAIGGLIKEGIDAVLSPGGGSTESYQPTIAPVLQGTTVPSEADILWQAKLAEVGPVPSGPAPSGYQIRGSSLTGAPLYEPVQAMIGTLELPDAPGTVAQVWQLGPSKMLKVGDVWLGENISACYLGGGWWDAPRGRCIYGAG